MGVAGAIVGAQATLSAASAYGQSKAGGIQSDVTKAEATISHAQQEYELARTAAIESEAFRRDLASTVASASGRGGAGMARQFGTQAFNTYSRDIEAINRAYKINDIQKQNKYAQANALKASTQINSIVDLGKNILAGGASAYNTSVLEKALGKTTTPQAPAIPTASGVADVSSFAPSGVDAFKKYSANNPYAPTSEIAGTKSGKWDPLG